MALMACWASALSAEFAMCTQSYWQSARAKYLESIFDMILRSGPNGTIKGYRDVARSEI
jgi:hypothetical protein